MPEQLAQQPAFPEEVGYLWDWFLELKGSEPLSFTEIKAWMELRAIPLASSEVDVLKQLDRMYWRVMYSD